MVLLPGNPHNTAIIIYPQPYGVVEERKMTTTNDKTDGAQISGFRWGGPNGAQVVLAVTVLSDEGKCLFFVDHGFLRDGSAGPGVAGGFDLGAASAIMDLCVVV